MSTYTRPVMLFAVRGLLFGDTGHCGTLNTLVCLQWLL